ncbi:cupin domain-containing protein [Geomicrobium sp. JCM 19039]|uniref:cupin domain-containing protein n=1 Tax=Geomicrobium sp. JCM 19039 TaxID=1460636 RepID=UPI00045F2EBE|nr:cupin domain-containing protein [Geomicrobium sp. JCM 19039]GAK14711.1 hypothetical protein JCM19039_4652 [Geomicrobium sp. JCM 19039]
MTSKAYWIQELNMQSHREGGYFALTFQADGKIKTRDGRLRSEYSSIYFLLDPSSPSHFHRLKSDEVWYYHDGEPLTIHMIHPDGTYEAIRLGTNVHAGETLSYPVRAGVIFGSTVRRDYALVSCLVSPGFDYEDFELFTQKQLLAEYPQHEPIIRKLAYEQLPDA